MLLLYVLVSGLATAWWCTGHMVVATIAEQQLAAATQATVQQYLDNLPQSLVHDIGTSMAENACWADDEWGTYGLTAMFNWHFLDQPYNPEGIMNIVQYAPGNVLWAAQQALGTLSSANRASAPFETGLMLRYLVHLIGDMHQPLHVSCMFSEQYPQGDQGGNLVPIEFDQDIQELHALWDAALGHMEVTYSRPLNATSLEAVENWALEITQEFPRSALSGDLSVTNMTDWTTTNFQIASTFVYPGITPGQHPSEAYLDAGWEIAKRQLALAGYRLGDLLESLFAAQEEKHFSI